MHFLDIGLGFFVTVLAVSVYSTALQCSGSRSAQQCIIHAGSSTVLHGGGTMLHPHQRKGKGQVGHSGSVAATVPHRHLQSWKFIAPLQKTILHKQVYGRGSISSWELEKPRLQSSAQCWGLGSGLCRKEKEKALKWDWCGAKSIVTQD